MTAPFASASEIEEAINSEKQAARGQLIVSVRELTEKASSASTEGRLTTATWHRLKAAEILCSDCQHQEAWELYQQILPDLKQIPDRLQIMVQRNFSFVGLVIGQDTYRTFYESVDRASGEPGQTQRTSNLLAAEDASRKRAHYDSIPALWRELKRAYLEADWAARKSAHNRLAWETLQAGWINQAVHHSLYGENKDSAKQLGTWLIKWRKLDLIESASRVAISSELLNHAEIGSRLLGQLADVLPDDHIARIIDWALRVLARTAISRQAIYPMSTCWICLRQLAFRFSFDQAHTVMQAALGHPLFNSVNTARQEIVHLILACLNKVRDYDYVLLTRQVLPLVSTLRFQGDFGSVIELLAAISKRSLDAKAVIAGELFPQGQNVSDLTLLKHLADFGKPPKIEFRRKVIENVTNFIGDQVWVGDGEPPIPRLCSFGTMDGSRNGLQIRVALSGGAQELNLIAGFGEALNAETLDPLIAPVLRTLQHRFNTTENRLLLIQFLFEIRAQLSNAQAETICTALLPFARGHRTERSPFDSHEESTVSRFNIRGTPSLARERGGALVALVFIAARYKLLDAQILDVLDEALLDADSEVREAGFRGLTALPELSALQKLYLVAALQDREIRAACSACEAARVFLQRGSLSTHIPSILASAYYGAMSEAPELRFGVARVVDAIVSSGVPPEVGGLCRRTIRLLKSDAHYSIRSVFSRLKCGDCSETENTTA